MLVIRGMTIIFRWFCHLTLKYIFIGRSCTERQKRQRQKLNLKLLVFKYTWTGKPSPPNQSWCREQCSRAREAPGLPRRNSKSRFYRNKNQKCSLFPIKKNRRDILKKQYVLSLQQTSSFTSRSIHPPLNGYVKIYLVTPLVLSIWSLHQCYWPGLFISVF